MENILNNLYEIGRLALFGTLVLGFGIGLTLLKLGPTPKNYIHQIIKPPIPKKPEKPTHKKLQTKQQHKTPCTTHKH